MLKRDLTGLICMTWCFSRANFKNKIKVVMKALPGPEKDFGHMEFGTAPIEALPKR